MARTTELLSRERLGGASGFAELVRRYQGLVFAACYEQTGSLVDSEDLTQEVFLAAQRGLPSLQQPEKVAPWLRGIARNLCRMKGRQSRREIPLAEPPDCSEAVADAAPSLELKNLIHDALMGVTARSREVLSLHYLGGHSYAEIGALCAVPTQLVRSRLHEGRSQLRSRLLEVVANLCECSRDTQHRARCEVQRCGAEPCGCVDRLKAL